MGLVRLGRGTRRAMEILLVTTELSPRVSSTDTPDEVSALGKTLRQLGHDVTIVAPFNHAFEQGGLSVARRLTPIALTDGQAVTVFDAHLSSGAKVVLLGMPSGLDAQLSMPTLLAETEVRSASAFADAVVRLVAQRLEQGQPFDVVHLFDWMTALVASVLHQRLGFGSPAIVLSVHDPRAVGEFEARFVPQLGDESQSLETQFSEGKCSVLKTGIIASDSIVVPSESHIEVMMNTAARLGLGASLSEQSKPIHAVQAGVDYSRVNPATNPNLVARFDAEDASAKAATKTALLRDLGLALDNRPLFLFPGPMSLDGGGDLVVDAAELVLAQPVSTCFFSMPHDDVQLVSRLEQRIGSPLTNCVHRVCTSERDLHRGFAAADFVVCPARHVGGRVDHLAAQRYGAVVVALNAPGLREAVVDCDTGLETGTGFLFDDCNAASLSAALMRATAAYYHPGFDKLRRRVMRQDFSWERPARRMLQIYRKAYQGRPHETTADESI